MNNKSDNIQGLRAVAALLVLASHFRMVAGDVSYLNWPFGAIGVDLFFCISGYVMCLTIDRKELQPKEFMLSRIVRITPLYFILSLGSILVHEVRSIILHRADAHYSFQTLWNSFFFIPLFDFGKFGDPVIYCGWTLCFEMWFYCMLAFFLWCGVRKRLSTTIPLMMFVATLVTELYRGQWYLPRFLFNPISLEFSLGCLAFALQSKIKSRGAVLCLALAVPAFLVGARYFDYPGHNATIDDSTNAWIRWICWGLPCGILITGVAGIERSMNLRLPQFLVHIGDYSYSLYLVQFITLGMFSSGIARKWLFHPILLIFVFTATTLWLSWLSWTFIEKPSSAFLKRKLWKASASTGVKTHAREA